MEPPFAALRHPLILAHRGSAVLGPENTLYSFDLALTAGADVLELDVHPSADGRIVVIHDDTVDRTSNGHGLVREKSLKELRKLDFAWRFSLPDSEGYPMRSRGFAAPTLDEVFDRFKESHFSIDIKEDDLGFADEVARLVRKRALRDRVVLASFFPRVTAWLRSSVPPLSVAADRPQALRLVAGSLARRAPADVYLLPDRAGPFPFAGSRALIRAAHARGRRIYAWTVDDPARMQTLFGRGIDGVVTNRPDLAFAARTEYLAGTPGTPSRADRR